MTAVVNLASLKRKMDQSLSPPTGMWWGGLDDCLARRQPTEIDPHKMYNRVPFGTFGGRHGQFAPSASDAFWGKKMQPRFETSKGKSWEDGRIDPYGVRSRSTFGSSADRSRRLVFEKDVIKRPGSITGQRFAAHRVRDRDYTTVGGMTNVMYSSDLQPGGRRPSSRSNSSSSRASTPASRGPKRAQTAPGSLLGASGLEGSTSIPSSPVSPQAHVGLPRVRTHSAGTV